MQIQVQFVTKLSKNFRDYFYITIFAVILFLLIDFFAGQWLLSVARNDLPKDKFRIQHDIYHHTLKPNYNGVGYWGPGTYLNPGKYHICTNGSAFKDRCENVGLIEKSFDIGFIGDSFTEGVGMPFEDSFVGMIANKYPQLKIANLGVVSYAPSIYLAKLKEFYEQGYTFKNIIVFIDIGDVQDEALTYEVVDGKVLSKHEQLPDGFIPKLRRYASRLFPLTGLLWNKIKFYAEAISISSSTVQPVNNKSTNTLVTTTPVQTTQNDYSSNNQKAEININTISPIPAPPIVVTNAPVMPNAPIEEVSIYDRGYTRSAWTFNPNTPGYGPDGIQGTLNKMVKTMEELYELTRAHGSTLSVGVYPWPGQIKYDTTESLQVKTWEKFCQNRCKHFYNSFPAFFKIKADIGEDALIYKYYMLGDMHFNAQGNQIIAETVIQEGIQ